MRPSVQSAWISVNSRWEYFATFMYKDVKNLVTTGVGNMIDPVSLALPLAWQNPDGSPTSAADVTAAWNVVKQSSCQSLNCAKLTTTRLSTQAVNNLAMSKLASNWTALLRLYPSADSWPADAQFAISSMAWAMGTGWLDGRIVSPTEAHFPQLHAALNKSPPDFLTAAANSKMIGQGIDPRNAANAAMFKNAAAVVTTGADPSILYWPGTPGGVTPPAPATPPAAPATSGSGPLVALALVALAGATAYAYVHRHELFARPRPYRPLLARENPSPPARSQVQSLLFDRRRGWTPARAHAWALRHGYRARGQDVTPGFVHLRVAPPGRFERIRTVPFGSGGVQARIGWQA